VVLGWVAFGGLRIVVSSGVFVPRARTALVATTALALLEGVVDPVVVDLCCGTAAVGAVVAAARPDATVHACDVDPTAVACARRNLPPDRVHEGDLFDALPRRLRGRLDVVAANAPYVPRAAIATMPPEAREHEPAVALDGGADGLDVHRRIAEQVASWLAPGGAVVVETSSSQSAATADLLAVRGLTVELRRDPSIDATVVVGRRPGPDRASTSGRAPVG